MATQSGVTKTAIALQLLAVFGPVGLLTYLTQGVFALAAILAEVWLYYSQSNTLTSRLTDWLLERGD